jgi:ABC-type antimicrobial peptide transport system permease subunit
MQKTGTSTTQSLSTAIGLALLAGVLGLGSGSLMAWLTPPDKFSWAGLAIAPLWLLLEVFFETVVGIFGYRTKTTRIASTIAVLIGFYVAWFALRGVAP